VIYETVVICRLFRWFPVFCARRNEWRWICWSRFGRYFVNAMGKRTLI